MKVKTRVNVTLEIEVDCNWDGSFTIDKVRKEALDHAMTAVYNLFGAAKDQKTHLPKMGLGGTPEVEVIIFNPES